MKILISGYYGFGNLGDELILSSIILQLRERYGQPAITVLSQNPEDTMSTHGIKAVSRWNPFVVIREIWRNDVFLLGGGGLLQNATSSRSLLYYMALIAAARLLRCPTVLFAMGVESVHGRLIRWLLGKVLTGENIKITVRDDGSKAILKQVGIDPSKIHVTADPVFARPVSATPKDRYSVGASALLIPRFPCPAIGRRLFAIAGRILKDEKKIRVRGLLFQPQIEKDFLRRFDGESILSEQDFFGDLTLEDMVNQIPQHDWIISARFHGLVLAALAGKPFIGVGDAHKVGRICDLMRMPFLPWHASEEEIVAAIDRLARKNGDVQRAVVAQLRSSALQTTLHVG